MAIFTNRATLTYNDVTRNSNIATGEILEVLSASKTAVVDEYGINDDITYIVSIVNSGTTALTGLSVTDSLGAYTVNETTVYPLSYVMDSVKYYVNGVLQATPTVTAGPPLVFDGLSVPAQGNAMLVYAASVNEFASPTEGGTITNTATVSGDGLTTPVTATETVTAVNGPDLSIDKSISPSTVTDNSRVTYTFTIRNYGNQPAEATDNASVTDIFDPILTDLAVTFNGAVWTEPTNYTYDESTGTFVTVPGQITVPAATFTQDPVTGVYTTVPGVSVLTVEGTI
ncbi:MAG: hypothetical protein IJO48_06105 [Clostridia bacterium]|nr:hypothetical protein [Clostridia bacterium]